MRFLRRKIQHLRPLNALYKICEILCDSNDALEGDQYKISTQQANHSSPLPPKKPSLHKTGQPLGEPQAVGSLPNVAPASDVWQFLYIF
jgi:hypothetical protein